MGERKEWEKQWEMKERNYKKKYGKSKTGKGKIESNKR